MSKPVVLVNDGKLTGVVGTVDGQVLTWDDTTGEWKAEALPAGSGTVTSIGLSTGTSGIPLNSSSTNPITTSGTISIPALPYLAFDTTTPTAPTLPGQISWNTTEGSLNTLMVGGNVDAIVGQQLYQRVVNVDSVTLTKGMVVYVYGSTGTRVSAKRAQANADLNSAAILGVVAESIGLNAEGFVLTAGLLRDLSVLPSTSFNDGDVIYLSPTTPGAITATKPVAPQHLVTVGYVVKASNGAAGVMLVHVQNGYELDELHNVKITSPTSGQTLVYNGDSGKEYWQNSSITGTANRVTVTLGAGTISLSGPQDLGTTNSPTFAGLTLTGLTGYLKGNGASALTNVATIPVADGGTGAALSVAQGAVIYAASGTALAGLAAATNGQFLMTQGASADPVFSGVPYDLSGASVGTYSNSQVIFRFVAPRAITLNSTAANHDFKALTASTGNVTVLLKAGATTLLSVAFNASATGTVTVSSTAIAKGDEVTCVMPSTADATLAGVYFTAMATALGV